MAAHSRTRKGDAMSRLMTAYRGYGYVKLAGALVSGVAIFALMLWIVADVVSRNFVGGSISGSFEVAQNYFMPLAVFPALAYVYGAGVLPKMDLLMHKAPASVQAVTVQLLLATEVVVLALLAYYTWGYATTGMERGTAFPAGGSLYTLWPLYFVVPVAFAMVLLETLFVIAKNLLGDTTTLAMHEGPEVEAL
jgi:TRAP-type C4-dicarboxylate transport system permease small subunit